MSSEGSHHRAFTRACSSSWNAQIPDPLPSSAPDAVGWQAVQQTPTQLPVISTGHGRGAKQGPCHQGGLLCGGFPVLRSPLRHRHSPRDSGSGTFTSPLTFAAEAQLPPTQGAAVAGAQPWL